jgi:branched-subunit amino acid ABC-type transport system permease component
MIAASFVIILAIIIVYRRSSFGLNLRAVIQNKEVAKALGIDAERTYQIAFGAGAGLAAIAGALVAPTTVISAHMGLRYLGKAFFVVIVGGTGTIAGVLAGSTFIGGLEVFFNEFVDYALSPALVLILAIIVVRFRGGGLIKGYGRSQEDYVKAF